MDIETVVHESFSMVVLHNVLTIATFSSLTPKLTFVIQRHPDKDLVLDLSDVPSMDTNSVRLLINLNKKLETTQQKLHLLNPCNELKNLFAATPGAMDIAVTSSVAELQRNANNEIFRKYLPYTIPEDGHLRLRLSCGVCGSANVFGYLLEQNDYVWSWPANDYFPECRTKSGAPFDYFNILPIVCSECLTASIDINDFNVLKENNTIAYHCAYNDQTKVFLSKTIKKRKKMVEDVSVVAHDDFFGCPRNRQSAYFCYLLAESCSRAASINNTESNIFYVGYLNYLALYFAEKEHKQALIDDCRTWLTQTISTPERYSHNQLAQSYFIIFVALLSLNKYKESSKMMTSLNELMKQSGVSGTVPDSISCPQFWFMRADTIWKEEIAKKSAIITL